MSLCLYIQVASLHPGCIEMPSQQDDKLTVNTNCVKAATRGDQAAVEAFLTGQCGPLIGPSSCSCTPIGHFRELLQLRVCHYPG